jgi:hypothetical protein
VVAYWERDDKWTYQCRLCGKFGLGTYSYDGLIEKVGQHHAECEAAWQQGER